MKAVDFAKDLLKEVDEMEEDIGRTARQLVSYGLITLVARTPIDTGYASENWNVSIGAINTSVTPGVQPGRSLAQGQQTIKGVTASAVSYVTNSVEYIDALENGHSQQAPNGMVSVAYAEISSFSLNNLVRTI